MVPGNPARRVAVIYQGDRAYLFVGVVKVGSLETQDDRFLSVIRSFRPLRDKERALRSRDACTWCRSRRADAGAIGGWRRGVIE